MRKMNRAAFVVRPREPYLRWAAGVDEDAPAEARSLAGRAAVYLVPEDPTGREETPPLADYFEEIFRVELESWDTEERGWPPVRDLKIFLEWFEVVGQSMVVDLGEDEPELEEY